MSFRVRVRVRGLVLGPLGPWAIWVPGSLGPPGPSPGPKEHEFQHRNRLNPMNENAKNPMNENAKKSNE